MAPRLLRSRAISRCCCCRHALPNSTAKKTSGSSCVKIGCQTESSNPSTISSTTVATLGTRSSISPGRSCPSRVASGPASVTQCEDWYKSVHVEEDDDGETIIVQLCGECDSEHQGFWTPDRFLLHQVANLCLAYRVDQLRFDRLKEIEADRQKKKAT